MSCIMYALSIRFVIYCVTFKQIKMMTSMSINLTIFCCNVCNSF